MLFAGVLYNARISKADYYSYTWAVKSIGLYLLMSFSFGLSVIVLIAGSIFLVFELGISGVSNFKDPHWLEDIAVTAGVLFTAVKLFLYSSRKMREQANVRP
jgi:hypothetical protein